MNSTTTARVNGTASGFAADTTSASIKASAAPEQTSSLGQASALQQAARVSRTIEACCSRLAVLMGRLRPCSSGQAPKVEADRLRETARRAEWALLVGYLELQRLIDVLHEEAGARRQCERELAEAHSELQRANLELAGTQADERRARHSALHDLLTGLPNRISFEERSSRALARRESHGDAFGVMYIDLDGFKAINDMHGHSTGDALLKVIGARLVRAVRAEDSISRHGGDEFVCLLSDVHDEQQVAGIARKLFDAIAAPCQIGALSLTVTPSIGIALYPHDGETVDALVRSADDAMYRAKKHRLGHAFFNRLPAAAGARIPS